MLATVQSRVLEQARRSDWRRAALLSLGTFALSRLTLLAVGVLSRRLGGLTPASLHLWVQWDAHWYLKIAERGYQESEFLSGPAFGQSNVVFFPAYPLLVKVLALLVPTHLAGLLLSNACLVAAGALLHRYVEGRAGARAARTSVQVLHLVPGSFVFSGVMTESLFLLVSLGAFLCARQRAYGRAAALAAVACATRPTGLIVVLALAVDWVAGHAAREGGAGGVGERRAVEWRELLWLALAPLGLLAFMLFLHLRFGDAFAFVHVQQFWNRDVFHSPWPVVLAALRSDDAPAQLGALILLLTIAALLRARRVLTPGEWVLVVLAVGLPLCTSIHGVHRYIIGLFPVHLALGVLLARWRERGREALLVMAMLNALMMTLWARGHNVFV
jgi:hypothetical protein